MSFPNNLIIKPIGVTTKKNIMPMIKGDTIFPNNIPNLNQILFKGDKILEFNNPKTKKIKEIINNHTFISPPWVRGYRAKSKNTIKNTIPKLLFELILTLSI